MANENDGGNMYYRFSDIEVHDHKLFAPTKNGDMYEICNAMKVTKRQINILTQEVVIYLRYWIHGTWHKFQMERKDFTKAGLISTFPKRGIQISERNAQMVLDYLTFLEDQAPAEYVHDQLGFIKIGKKRIFLHHKAIGAGEGFESTYTGNLKVSPKGTLVGEIKLIEDEVLGNIPLECAWVLGFSAPVISYFRGKLSLDNVIVHAYGKSSTGKSTSALLAISPFGLPSKTDPDSLFGTWLSTPNALIGRLSKNTGVPMIYDEASVQDSKTYDKIIYQMSSGLEKSRLTAESTMREKASWSTTIISNAENALLNQSNKNTGLRVRVLQFSNIKFTTSAQNSNAITNRLLENYGNSGIAFVTHLLSFSEEDLLDRFKACKEIVLASMKKKDDFSSRAADKLTVIVLTSHLVKEAFQISINTEGILQMLVDADEEQIEDRNIGLQAYSWIKEQVTANINKFIHQHDVTSYDGKSGLYEHEKLPYNEMLGRIEYTDDGKPKEVWILKGKLDDLLRDGGFTDSDVILYEWRDKEIINADKGKFTKKRAVFEKGSPVRVVILKLLDNEYEHNDDQIVDTIKINSKQVKVRAPTRSKISKVIPQSGNIDLFNDNDEKER